MISNHTPAEDTHSVVDSRLWNCLTPLVSNSSRWIGSVPKVSSDLSLLPLSETILDSSHESSLRCVTSHAQETKGLCKFLNGNVYDGEFRAGKMEGEGVYLWTEGIRYEGQVTGNKIQGKGTYRWTDGSVYSGEVREGLRNGTGVLKLPDGKYYDGEWRDGKMHGRGRMVYECDEEGNPVSYYEGEFRDNLKEGVGTRLYPSGNVYAGEWLSNLPHGNGRMEWRDRGEVYTGDWFEGVQNGYGEMQWETELVNTAQFPNKNRYSGDWRGGSRHGSGVMHYATGAVYAGSWTADEKEGTGIYTQPNGDRVEGEFREDKLFLAKEAVVSRPLTPVSELVGDVDELDSASRSEAFKRSLLHLIPDDLNPDLEVRAVHNILLANIGELKWIFHFYSNLGVCPDAVHSFTRLKLWQLLIDCQIFYKETFSEVDKLFTASLPDKHTPELIHDPCVEFLLREFLQCLVVLGHHLFSKLYGGQPGRLAWCLKYLLEETVLPSACRGSGYLYQTPELFQLARPYFAPCSRLYNAVCKQLNGTISYRDFLFMMDQCKVYDLIAVETILGFIIHSNPFVYEEDCYKVTLQMNLLEFFNILLCCAKLIGPSETAVLFEQLSRQGASNTEAAVNKMDSLYQSGSSVDEALQQQNDSQASRAQSGVTSDESDSESNPAAEEIELSAVIAEQVASSSKDLSEASLRAEEEPNVLLLPAYTHETPEEDTFVPVSETESAKWRRQLTTFFADNLFPGAAVAIRPPKYKPFSSN